MTPGGPAPTTDGFRRLATAVLLFALVVGALARLSVLVWSDPWGPHQPDEHIPPLEALALWEGVTPREVGWPASTLELVLSSELSLDWAWHEGPEAWRLRHEPGRVLTRLSEWIGNRYVDPTPLYQWGRATSIALGVVQLLALVWALRQWVGAWGVAIGTLAIAIGPLPVAYSQYVLADVLGLLFATILVGLAARVTPRRLVAMGALGGLAMCSKFHFGMWLLTCVLAIWLSLEFRVLRKVRLTLVTAAVASWVLITLVPWSWTNPVLFLKEFAGVVLVKFGSGAPIHLIPENLVTVYGSMGMLAWVGASLGVLALWRTSLRRLTPVLVPALIGTLVLAVSEVVFDRYGLVLLPGVAILAGVGWETWLEDRPRRILGIAALIVCVATTVLALVSSERRIGQTDVDVLAKQWILAHVPRGARVALQDEDNAFLPRDIDQLRSCVSYVRTPEAYSEKWSIEGVGPAPGTGEPERAAVLTDEAFAAYWYERELTVARGQGYRVLPYHPGPRFNARLESVAINEFRTNARSQSGEIDVLMVNREVDAGVPPAIVLRTARGVRAIYVAERVR